MVDVSYDGEVSDVWSSHFVHGILKRGPEPRKLYGRAAPIVAVAKRGVNVVLPARMVPV